MDENTTLETRPKEKYFKRWREKFSEMVEALIMVISICISIVIFLNYKHKFPHLDWPFYLDKILMFTLLFFIVYSILFSIKYIVVFVLIIGSIYLIFTVLVSVIIDYRTLTNKENSLQPITINNNIQAIFKDSLLKQGSIDSVKLEIKSIKVRMDVMAVQLDSFRHLMKGELQKPESKSMKK